MQHIADKYIYLKLYVFVTNCIYEKKRLRNENVSNKRCTFKLHPMTL